MAELDRVACATLASMTRVARACASLAAAKVRERVRKGTASPRPGAVGICWARTGGGVRTSGTLGEGAGITLGAGAGVLGGTTLGEWVGVLG